MQQFTRVRMVHRESSTAAGARTRTLAVPWVDFGILVDRRSNVCNENGIFHISTSFSQIWQHSVQFKSVI